MIEEILKKQKANIFEPTTSTNLENFCFAWIPVMQMDSPHILEITRNPSNYKTHDELFFEVKPVNKGHFKRTHTDQLPIHNLHLEQNQELLISPSKRRLCLIIAKHNIPNLDFITNTNQKEYANHLTLESFIAIPAYSCSTSSEPTSFCPEITDRIKHFIYPHLFYLPKYKDTANSNQLAAGLKQLSNAGSILRLDEMFSFNYNPAISKEKYKLTIETQNILRLNLQYIFGNKEPFKILRDKINNPTK